MQVAINQMLYNDAQVFAQKQGLNIDKVIEDFLVGFLVSAPTTKRQEQRKSIEITPRVANLLTGRSWNVTDTELDKIRYEYLTEKYK